MAHPYRVLIPNGLTFLSLLCGMAAILVSAATGTAADAPRHLWCAGLLILASYLIDWGDGLVARLLHASTAFGLQLDSLVDMVSLGLAPTVLLFMYGLRVVGVSPWLSGPIVVLVPLAGAFRLARFNLLPPKTTSRTDSVGLTISTGGALVTLAKPLNQFMVFSHPAVRTVTGFRPPSPRSGAQAPAHTPQRPQAPPSPPTPQRHGDDSTFAG